MIEKVEHTLSELPEIIKSLPNLGDDAEAFAKDLEEIRCNQPPLPEPAKWE